MDLNGSVASIGAQFIKAISKKSDEIVGTIQLTKLTCCHDYNRDSTSEFITYRFMTRSCARARQARRCHQYANVKSTSTQFVSKYCHFR